MGKLNFIIGLLVCIIPLYIINFTSFGMAMALLFLVTLNLIYKLFVISEKNIDLRNYFINNDSEETKKLFIKNLKRSVLIASIIAYINLFILNYIENLSELSRKYNNLYIVLSKICLIFIIISVIIPDFITAKNLKRKEDIYTTPGVSLNKMKRIKEKIKQMMS
ncbi:MAG: hypothetical protein KatS3mg079_005 [Caloramator sp.]|nr:MAG: hypothetical protein KatS3mg079_005 [Caloramator sp.]